MTNFRRRDPRRRLRGGLARAEKLEWRCDLARGAEPMETRRGLPGDPDDTHSRYIKAAIGDPLFGCLYMPNGNPPPGPLNSRSFRPVRRKESRARRWDLRFKSFPSSGKSATNLAGAGVPWNDRLSRTLPAVILPGVC